MIHTSSSAQQWAPPYGAPVRFPKPGRGGVGGTARTATWQRCEREQRTCRAARSFHSPWAAQSEAWTAVRTMARALWESTGRHGPSRLCAKMDSTRSERAARERARCCVALGGLLNGGPNGGLNGGSVPSWLRGVPLWALSSDMRLTCEQASAHGRSGSARFCCCVSSAIGSTTLHVARAGDAAAASADISVSCQELAVDACSPHSWGMHLCPKLTSCRGLP